MMSENNQRQSRSQLQILISQMNKSRRSYIKRTPRFRFRAAVRTVINNLKWLTEESTVAEVAKGPKLTIQTKGLLRTDVEDRSIEDKNYLFKVIGNLTCLQRYPEKVRQNLTASSIFSYYGPGRVLVMEGRPSFSMYFIISGQVVVTKMMYDAGDNMLKATEQATMSAGDSFGEINILHDEPWPTTVTTQSHTELLCVRKRDFQRILEEFLGEQKHEITRCLSNFEFFKDWTNRTVVECCILSRIQHYPKDTVIIGDRVGNLSNAYFIVSGECIVMYHLVTRIIDSKFPTEKLHKRPQVQDEGDTFPMSRLLKGLERQRMRKFGEPHLTHLIVNATLDKLISDLPLPDSNSSIKGNNFKEINVMSHFFQIALLMTGQCFGIGESLDDKFILSNTDLVVLEIPRHFLKLHNRGNIWGRVREFFNITYPTPEEIFKKFLMERKWQACRRRYLESILKVNRPFTGLTVAEQPYYYRLFEDILNPIFHRVKTIRVKESEEA